MSSRITERPSATADGNSPFHQRLVGRAVLFVVLPIIVGAAIIVTVNNRRNFANLRGANKQQLATETALTARRIGHQNRTAIVTAQSMAEAQVAGMFGNRKATLEYARIVLENASEFTGAYFGYEPNADAKDAESLGSLPAEAMDATGRFIPYWFIAAAKGNGIELEPLVDMETSLYYRGAKEAFAKSRQAAHLITEPYLYQGKMIVEHVYPIVIDGEFKGVAGVDRALTDVENDLRGLADSLGADAFLISSRGKFIAATTDPVRESSTETKGLLKTQAVVDTPYVRLFGRLSTEKQDTAVELVELTDDPVDGEPYYFAADYIPTGGWTLIMRKSEHDIVAPAWAAVRVGVALAVLFLAIVAGLLIGGMVSVSRRVNVAVSAAHRVAQGDLTQDVASCRSRDETGRLLCALRTMTQNLATLVGNVRQASIQLHSTATELTATSREQEGTASSFGASANQIAAAVKEISATGNELVQTMSEVHQVATGTAELATGGRASLGEMESSMRGLDQATGSIASKLAVINEKASNITGVVGTITKVADQTNLLSVNAAIEAEKAGEYGVGFLVVAREIRRLADQTAAATLDIEQMVQEMESAVSTGVMEMDRFSDHVRRSVKDVAEISHQMSQIIERVNANTASFERVNEGMRSQSEGADQISEAMGQLTANATRTSEGAREYAQAAADLQNAIGTLKSSIASFQLKS